MTMKIVRNGVEIELTPEEEAAFLAEQNIIPPATAADVDRERDRRIEAGFSFGGKLYQSRVQDQKRIAGAGTLALAAIVAGAQVGDLRWHGGETDFVWIAADDSFNPMDAQTCLAFGQAAARHETMHVFAGKALKSMDPIPADYTDDAYWP